MGDLLHLHNSHEQAQLLLPWYLNGSLEPGEAAPFEAHLAECGECRADLAASRALRKLYAETPVAGGPARPATVLQVDAQPRRAPVGWNRIVQVALAAAATVALIVTVAPGRDDDERFRLLGSPGAVEAGNAIVLFSPETAERDLRAALEQAGARLVDGPTASGAYVVHVPAQRRADALADLRALPQVVLAEPLDAARGP